MSYLIIITRTNEGNKCVFGKKIDYMFFGKKGYEEWRYIFLRKEKVIFPKVKLIVSEEAEKTRTNQSGHENL